MLPQLVVFDMAGTTIYDGDAVHRCLAQALEEQGCMVCRDEINQVMGLPKPVAIQALLLRRGFEEMLKHGDLVSITHTSFQYKMKEHYARNSEVRAVEGAEEIFRSLRAEGIKVALDTGFSRDIVDVILKRLKWSIPRVLDATIASDEVTNGRPYPDMIFRAMQHTGVTDVSLVAKIGDTPSDLQEGTAAGCGWVIGVLNGSHSIEELTPYAHTHLINSVANLLDLFALAS